MKAELKFSVPCTQYDDYYVESDVLTNDEVKEAIKACSNDPWLAEQRYELDIIAGKSYDPDTDINNLEWEDEYEERKDTERANKSV